MFRNGLEALVPVVEQARIPWKGPEAYDHWDDISEAIYRSIVIGALTFVDESDPFLPIPGYGFWLSSYAPNSFITNVALAEKTAFVCFETELAPFDTCLFAALDSNLNVVGKHRIATADTRFLFFRRDPGATAPLILDALNVSL